jgi:5-methyltetrahydrofolate--homocysteine methyltransferase
MALHLPALLQEAPIVTDGAWGTQLQERGLAPGACPDAWNLERPDQAEAIARSYVAAGSRVVLTNTFRANRITLADYNLADHTREINLAGAALSRRAAADSAWVFASMGPTGKLLLTGESTEQEIAAAFSEQAQALAEGGADAIVIETMTDLVEARLAVAAAAATGLPVVACMVFDAGKNKDRTMMGVTPEQAAEELARAGAAVIGANCGTGIAGYLPICRRLHAATALPIWIKPNAGLPTLVEGRAVYTTTPEEFGGFAPALIAAGASFIGGCCGTSPAFIEALYRTVAAPDLRPEPGG